MRDLVKVYKALSDETRLRILNLLLEGECCVCEVMQVLNISQTRASRNLNILYDADFLKVRREGLWAYYSIDKSNLNEYRTLLLDAVEVGLQQDAIASKDREHLKEVRPTGTKCCSPNTRTHVFINYHNKARKKAGK